MEPIVHKILEFAQPVPGSRVRDSLARRTLSARHDVGVRVMAFWAELGQFGDDIFEFDDEQFTPDLCHC